MVYFLLLFGPTLYHGVDRNGCLTGIYGGRGAIALTMRTATNRGSLPRLLQRGALCAQKISNNELFANYRFWPWDLACWRWQVAMWFLLDRRLHHPQAVPMALHLRRLLLAVKVIMFRDQPRHPLDRDRRNEQHADGDNTPWNLMKVFIPLGDGGLGPALGFLVSA